MYYFLVHWYRAGSNDLLWPVEYSRYDVSRVLKHACCPGCLSAICPRRRNLAATVSGWRDNQISQESNLPPEAEPSQQIQRLTSQKIKCVLIYHWKCEIVCYAALGRNSQLMHFPKFSSSLRVKWQSHQNHLKEPHEPDPFTSLTSSLTTFLLSYSVLDTLASLFLL